MVMAVWRSLFVRGVVVGACLFSPGAWADFTGRVVKVAGGDTLTVLREVNGQKEQVQVRLSSIDAPETTQAYGTRSRQLLSDLAFDRVVRVQEHGKDRYGRTLGVIHVGELNANREMVRQGLAWAYRQYLNDSALLRIESAARRAGRGLWADADPIAPWDHRRNEAVGRKARKDTAGAAAD